MGIRDWSLLQLDHSRAKKKAPNNGSLEDPGAESPWGKSPQRPRENKGRESTTEFPRSPKPLPLPRLTNSA